MKKSFVVLFAVSWLSVGQTFACDLCGCYNAEQTEKGRRGFSFSVFEQFTHFGTLRDSGDEVPNDVGQYLDSSITQFILSYGFNGRFSLQLNAPYIRRSFKRPEGFAIDQGVESGFGDISLLGNVRVLEHFTEECALIVTAMGGVKFPTGSYDRIREETMEDEVPGAPESGIHGHDLTLGSGSFDGIIGGSVFARHKRFFVSASCQYAMRTEGGFGYRFANDFMWSAGPGFYVMFESDVTVTLQLNCSGEAKGKDTFRGMLADDTGMTALYLGPEVTATWRKQLQLDVGVDLPVIQNNTALQAVPDYRVRAAVTWKF